MSQPRRKLSRVAFYAHLWLGVASTVVLLAVSVTGILLNHKRGLGLMPEVDHAPTGSFNTTVSLERIAAAALAAAPEGTRDGWTPGDTAHPALIDRMDVRPRDGLVKVRLRDAASTEVTVDINTAAILHVGPRGDVFLEKLHSGEIFGGQPFVLLSDFGAVALIVTLVTGYWLWLAPRLIRGPGAGKARDEEAA
ncbi:MAG: PepSY domain-containing protein [Gemmatimonadetes bacterium]|nr:PepSY domain-containing protein [Gemmatimonadota bacterium]